jgi:hypothetical protein
MKRHHEPMAIVGRADQRGPEGRPVGDIADRGALGRAELLDLFSCLDVVDQLQIPPLEAGVGRDDLHGLAELIAEAGRQVGMTGNDGVHGSTQALRIERAGNRDTQLDGVEILGGLLREAGVEQQALLHGRQRQHVGNPVLQLQLVELGLAQLGRRDVRRRQSAPTSLNIRTDTFEGLEP